MEDQPDLIGETDLQILKRHAKALSRSSESNSAEGCIASAITEAVTAASIDIATRELEQLRKRVKDLEHRRQLVERALLGAVIATGGTINISMNHDITCEGAELAYRHEMGRVARVDARPKSAHKNSQYVAIHEET